MTARTASWLTTGTGNAHTATATPNHHPHRLAALTGRTAPSAQTVACLGTHPPARSRAPVWRSFAGNAGDAPNTRQTTAGPAMTATAAVTATAGKRASTALATVGCSPVLTTPTAPNAWATLLMGMVAPSSRTQLPASLAVSVKGSGVASTAIRTAQRAGLTTSGCTRPVKDFQSRRTAHGATSC
jgi:hypothetical protein